MVGAPVREDPYAQVAFLATATLADGLREHRDAVCRIAHRSPALYGGLEVHSRQDIQAQPTDRRGRLVLDLAKGREVVEDDKVERPALHPLQHEFRKLRVFNVAFTSALAEVDIE